MGLLVQVCQSRGVWRPTRPRTAGDYLRAAGLYRRHPHRVPPRIAFQAALNPGVRSSVGTNLRIAKRVDIQDRIDRPGPGGEEGAATGEQTNENDPQSQSSSESSSCYAM